MRHFTLLIDFKGLARIEVGCPAGPWDRCNSQTLADYSDGPIGDKLLSNDYRVGKIIIILIIIYCRA